MWCKDQHDTKTTLSFTLSFRKIRCLKPEVPFIQARGCLQVEMPLASSPCSGDGNSPWVTRSPRAGLLASHKNSLCRSDADLEWLAPSSLFVPPLTRLPSYLPHEAKADVVSRIPALKYKPMMPLRWHASRRMKGWVTCIRRVIQRYKKCIFITRKWLM